METKDLLIPREKEIKQVTFHLGSNSKEPILITGRRGAGKTTFLRQIIDTELKSKQFDNVIYFSAQELIENSCFEKSLLKELYKEYYLEINQNDNTEVNRYLIEILSNKKILLLIDDLDSISNDLIEKILSKIHYLNSIEKINIHLISATSNNLSQESIVTNFSKTGIIVALNDLNKKQINDILTRRLNFITNNSEKEKIINTFFQYTKIIAGLSFPIALIEPIIRSFGTSYLNKVNENIKKNELNIENILSIYLNEIHEKISDDSKQLIRILSAIDDLITVENLELFIDLKQDNLLDSFAELQKFNLIIVSGNMVSFSHKLLKDYYSKFFFGKPENEISKTLDVYIDTSFFTKDEILNFFGILNETYQALGGDELIIREDEIRVLNCSENFVKA